LKRLNRAATPAPIELNNYQHGVHNWSHVTNQDKQAIRSSLERMQGKLCAYCEASLEIMGQHIEHFRRKAQFPHLEFAWNNLYWSCDKSDSCGHFKDSKATPYDINEIIDPCFDDPDHFFRFRADGTISVRHGLNETDRRKASETLRVFNLDPDWGRLRNMRKGVLAGYLSLTEEIQKFSEDDLVELLEDELNSIVGQPFSTAIRHVLTNL